MRMYHQREREHVGEKHPEVGALLENFSGVSY